MSSNFKTLILEQENKKKKEASARTLNDEEKFVQDLYSKVHTQSTLLQNQMTLNIISEIKERERRVDDPNEQ